MRFEPATIDFLEGKKFSSSEPFKVAEAQQEIILRLDYLEKLAAGKKIVHIGFADHLPIIRQRVETNMWLHKRLMHSAERVIGIDIDREATEFVQREFGIEDLYLHNLETDPPLAVITSESWDYMILGEIVEHLDNPVAFLKNIREKYGANVRRLVITVPNAMRRHNWKMALRGIEQINTDHRFWWTPFTLAKVAQQAGFKVEGFEFCEGYPVKKWHWQQVLKRWPMLREGLIMTLSV